MVGVGCFLTLVKHVPLDSRPILELLFWSDIRLRHCRFKVLVKCDSFLD